MKQRNYRKGISWLIVICLLFGMMATIPAGETYADITPVEAAIDNAINNYYIGHKDKVLDDWEELAAIYSYMEGKAGNSYKAGVDISDFVLPDVGTGAGGLFTALMKGDKEKASVLANSLVDDGEVVSSSYISTYAMQVLALEAYNKSGGVTPIIYNTGSAISFLLSSQDETGGYISWGSPSYDDGGLALTVLSLPQFKDYPGITEGKASLIAWIKKGQSLTGAYASFGSDSANSTACVLYGLTASGEDLSLWDKSPAVGLLDSSIYSNTDGWYTSWSGSWDAYAVKQATLALTDVNKGTSFYANLELNKTQYISVSMKMCKPDGSYVEEEVTVPSGASLDFVAGKVSGSSVSGDFSYYKDGSAVSSVSEGDSILAVAKTFDYITYFSYEGSGPGVPKVNVAFADSAGFTISCLDLSTGGITLLANASIDLNGDTYGDLVSDALGVVNIMPISKTTDLNILTHTYDDETYTSIRIVPTNSAILPAEIIMAKGGTQVKTVSVRVEGPTENIVYYSAYDVTGDGSRLLTAGDAVTQVLSKAGISYTYTGGYLSEVNHIYAGSYGYDGWLYFMNGAPGGGLGSQIISDGDDIIVYYGYYPGFGTDLVTLESVISEGIVTLRVLSGTAPVQDVTVFWNGSSLPSATDVKGEVLVGSVTPGTYTVQVLKSDTYGVPQLVRLISGTAITITAKGESTKEDGSGLTETAKEVFLTVKGTRGATIYSKTGQPYYVGITARDVLDNSGLSIKGTRAYVASINGLGEFDEGEYSGWLFTVNGDTTGTIASNKYRLAVGDEVLWYYSIDYRKDAGSASWSAENSQDAPSYEAVIKGDKATLSLAKGDLEKINKEGAGFRMVSSIASVRLDQKTLDGILKQGIKELELMAEKVAEPRLTSDQLALIGNRPVFEFALRSGNRDFASFEGKVTITLPYKLQEGESEEEVLVYFLKEDGTIEGIRATSYNEKTGEVTFAIDHFSKFAVGYRPNPFTDIINHWAKPWISYLSVREIVNGVTSDTFIPDKFLTRAEFAQILMNLEGNRGTKESSLWPFKDGDSNAWYGLALMWGFEEGLFKGSPSLDGTLLINPDHYLTREDMAVVINRYREKKGIASLVNNDKSVPFADESQISSYAKEAVSILTRAEVLNGKGDNMFDPKGITTRGEGAKVVATMLKQELAQ